MQVDVDDLAELLGGLAQRGHGRADAGVVDQHVDPAQALDGRGHQPVAVFRPGHVGLDGQARAAGLLDQPTRLLQPIRAPGADHHVGARLRQAPGEGHAEAR